MTNIPQATNIDEVINNLDNLILQLRNQNSRLAYFTCLYRHVTIAIKAGLHHNTFDYPDIIEKLDVAFANRYFAALDAYQNGRTPTQAWLLSFQAGQQNNLIVLQHLLLAMNAHINLDLGVAVAQTCPPDKLAAFEADFKRVNNVLFSLVNQAKEELAKIWPPLKWLNRFAGKEENAILDFNMAAARQFSWDLAQELSPLSPTDRTSLINKRDKEIVILGKIIPKPIFPLNLLLWVIRRGERGTIRQKIDIMADMNFTHTFGA